MARVTVEDCVKKVPSRFKLVAVATQRAREIISGAKVTVDTKKDKPAVTALREIASGTVDTDKLSDLFVNSLRSVHHIDNAQENELSTSSEDNEELFEVSTEAKGFFSEEDVSSDSSISFDDEVKSSENMD